MKKNRVPYRSVLGFDDHKTLASFYGREIEGAKIDSDEKDAYVVKAIKLFGDHVIELSESLGPLRLSTEANCLGGIVCRVLGSVTHQALRGSYGERNKAKRRLAKIVRGIFPGTRGKKKNTVNPLEVEVFYWKELFRLYHIQNALRTPGKSHSVKVKTASRNFDMPVERIRDLWKLDKDSQPTVRPISIKEMARILTAQHFAITQHRVSNILAS